jgi:hypothetical protein
MGSQAYRQRLTIMGGWWRLRLDVEPKMTGLDEQHWRSALERIDEALRLLGGAVAPGEVLPEALEWDDIEAMEFLLRFEATLPENAGDGGSAPVLAADHLAEAIRLSRLVPGVKLDVSSTNFAKWLDDRGFTPITALIVEAQVRDLLRQQGSARWVLDGLEDPLEMSAMALWLRYCATEPHRDPDEPPDPRSDG